MIIKANNTPMLTSLYATEKNKEPEGIFKKLSAGQISSLFKIEDPPALNETMSTKIRELNFNARYAQEAVAIAQTAQEGLDKIQTDLERMLELTNMASEDVWTDEDRQKIQEEINNLNKKIDDTVDKTKYKGHKILSDEPETDEGEGASDDDIVKNILEEFAKEFGQRGFTSKDLGTDKVDVSSAEAAQNSVKIVEQALKDVKDELKNWKSFEGKYSRYFEFEAPEDSSSLRNNPSMVVDAVEIIKYNLLKADATLLLANSEQDPDSVTSLLK